MVQDRGGTVPAIIDSLQQDHRNMEQLLQILEQELAVFNRAERPDFEIMTGIVEYFRGYPDQVHHPKEDLVAARLAARDPERIKVMIDIEAEHGQAGRRLERLFRLVEGIINEQEIARATLDAAAAEFIAHERRHMEIEERELFPVALAVLTTDDWVELDARLRDAGDPLFNRQIEIRFEALAKRLAAWELEDEAQRDPFREAT